MDLRAWAEKDRSFTVEVADPDTGDHAVLTGRMLTGDEAMQVGTDWRDNSKGHVQQRQMIVRALPVVFAELADWPPDALELLYVKTAANALPKASPLAKGVAKALGIDVADPEVAADADGPT